MISHFLSVGAALVLTLWSTVVAQYHEFRTSPVPPSTQLPSAEDVSLAQPPTPTPFEIVVEQIVTSASSTAVVSSTTQPSAPAVTVVPPGPVTPTAPSVPFTPLPPIIPPVITPPTATSTPVIEAPPVVSPEAELSDEALLKSALVNIVCVSGGGVRGSSGSGVIVDPRGIILTVAHVAQHHLLRDYPSEEAKPCYIRTGSPAKNAYIAEVIYVSPSWVEENPGTFLHAEMKGTGENDFAFLAITRSTSSASLPSQFPYIPLSVPGTDVDEGDRVGTGSYAAEFLSSSELRSSLYPTIKFADVSEIATFARRGIDIFSVSAGSAAQAGSSGGAVINEDDYLIGVITTRDISTGLSFRTLQALTIDHLRRSFRSDMGEDMDAYLKSSLSTLVNKFSARAVELQDILLEEIEATN